MDILKTLDSGADYSTRQLQLILGAWVLSAAFEGTGRVSTDNGDIAEDDYTKQSIYALLYSLYRSMGEVKSETGKPYELTFNTWGYTWPDELGSKPATANDPQRFGKNAYTGLLEFAPVKERVQTRNGEVHLVEMGCGTGAGAHHICKNVLPACTYEAVDMQRAAIQTCRRRFVPELGGRLVATHADCTEVPIDDGAADIVAVCETHVTEHAGESSDEDQRFFRKIRRILKPGGYLVWGNAIPDSTWQPNFDFLASIGMKLVEARDVTKQAVAARDEDQARVRAYIDQAIAKFHGFRIPFLGRKRKLEAELALRNFFRDPGTNLYDNMTNGTDTYKVVLVQKADAS